MLIGRCAKVRVAAEPHTDLPALVMLGALLRDARIKRSTATDAADSGVSPLSGDQNRGETMLRQSRQRPARRRAPQQIDLFAKNAPTIGGVRPVRATMETQAALTTLMTRLILDNAASAGWNRRGTVMISDKIRPHHLGRKAILYIRQSSAHQVLHNREAAHCNTPCAIA